MSIAPDDFRRDLEDLVDRYRQAHHPVERMLLEVRRMKQALKDEAKGLADRPPWTPPPPPPAPVVVPWYRRTETAWSPAGYRYRRRGP